MRNLRDMLARVGPLLGLTVVWVLFALLRPETFTSWENQRLMLLQTAVVGTAAVGATLIIIGGGIDLSVGSTIALGTVVIALLLETGVPAVLAALGGVACGVGVGLLIGLLVNGTVLRVKLPPFIVTLGLWGALRGLAKGLANNQFVYPESSWLNAIMSNRGTGLFALLAPGVWIFLLTALLAGLMLRRTRLGLHLFAIGSNEATARLCGVRVERTKLLVYAMGVGCAGLASVLQFAYLSGIGDPTTAQGLELQVIAAVVIGGASLLGGEGGVWGSIVGALIMTVVDNGCTKLGLDNWVQEIATGGIILAAVALDRARHRAAG